MPSTPTTLEILMAARAKIANPDNWTQHSFARDFYGNTVSATDPSACRWCSIGALLNVGNNDAVLIGNAIDVLMIPIDDGRISTFNDNHSHDEVLKMWDTAIELA